MCALDASGLGSQGLRPDLRHRATKGEIFRHRKYENDGDNTAVAISPVDDRIL